MLGEALKPYKRDTYQLMSKVTTDPGADPLKRFDEMRRVSQTEYFDIMLLHWQHTGSWVRRDEALAGWNDTRAIAKHYQDARSFGARAASSAAGTGEQVS
jgi:diketogulonate reductase-like aldo/keto reductase